MSSKKKLLWISDSPRIPFVGQSVVARECLSRLQDRYEVAALGFGDAAIKNPVSVPYAVIHCDRTDMGDANKVTELIKGYGPDVVLFSHDPWLFPSLGQVRANLPHVRFIGYMTLDGEPAYYKFYETLKPYHKIITPTNFSSKVITDRWFDLYVATVPYGIEHSIFHPPKQGKEQLKHDIHASSGGLMPIAGRFVAFYVGANQDRKNLGLIHEAWREFERGKEGSVICCMFTHSASLTQEIGTYDLSVFITDTKSLMVNPQPQNRETIGQMMAASDILFHPSSGEGFGLTVLEAMAAGTVPVILPFAGVTDFCSEDNSYQVPFTLFVGGFHAHRAIASVKDTVEKLELAYKNHELRKSKSLACIETAKKYTWERTAELLKENIDEVLSIPNNTIQLRRIA